MLGGVSCLQPNRPSGEQCNVQSAAKANKRKKSRKINPDKESVELVPNTPNPTTIPDIGGGHKRHGTALHPLPLRPRPRRLPARPPSSSSTRAPLTAGNRAIKNRMALPAHEARRRDRSRVRVRPDPREAVRGRGPERDHRVRRAHRPASPGRGEAALQPAQAARSVDFSRVRSS